MNVEMGEDAKIEFQAFLDSMRKIWMENLAIESVNDDDNYFVLGGDSLKGIKLIAAVKKHFDIELDYMDIFEYQEFLPLANRVYELRVKISG